MIFHLPNRDLELKLKKGRGKEGGREGRREEGEIERGEKIKREREEKRERV